MREEYLKVISEKQRTFWLESGSADAFLLNDSRINITLNDGESNGIFFGFIAGSIA